MLVDVGHRSVPRLQGRGGSAEHRNLPLQGVSRGASDRGDEVLEGRFERRDDVVPVRAAVLEIGDRPIVGRHTDAGGDLGSGHGRIVVVVGGDVHEDLAGGHHSLFGPPVVLLRIQGVGETHDLGTEGFRIGSQRVEEHGGRGGLRRRDLFFAFEAGHAGRGDQGNGDPRLHVTSSSSSFVSAKKRRPVTGDKTRSLFVSRSPTLGGSMHRRNSRTSKAPRLRESRPQTGVVVFLLLLVAACGDPMGPGPAQRIEELPRALTAAEVSLIGGSNEFGLGLLSEVTSSDERPNIVLSPLSASMALGMTMNGAVDGTYRAMQSTLGFSGLEPSEINEGYRGLIDLLGGLDPAVTFEIANAIWANEDVTFHTAFFDAVMAAFDARVESADFGDPMTLEDVNGWVTEKTSGKITEILRRLSPDLIMLLLNAIYFDGQWTLQFDPEKTAPGSFTRPDGSQVTVDMMSMTEGEFRFGGGEGFQMAELPYGGEAFSMVVMVPWDGDARALAGAMDADRWEEALGSLHATEVDLLSIPKLALTYDALLNQPLADMGMAIAFGAAADFSAMSPQGQDFCIAFVRQKTFLEVDEAGTRAAAVTAVGIGETSFTGLVADRPFLFAIRERLSGTIIFAGLVEDPTAEAEDADDPPSTCG